MAVTVRRPRARGVLLALSSLLALVVAPVAGATEIVVLLDPHPDAGAYAAAHGVSLNEAAHRLSLHDDAAELDAILLETYPTQYAGLWLQHKPEFRIITHFTADVTSADIAKRSSPEVADLIDVRLVEHSLHDLEVRVQTLSALAAESRIALSLDVIGNRVLVQLTAQSDVTAIPSFAEAAGVVVDDQVYITRPAAIALLGGFGITQCTSGFVANVQDRPHLYRMTTAGHCPDGQTYTGRNMPFILEKYQGSHDEQSHSIADTVPTNEFMAGSPYAARQVKRRIFRLNQPINGWTCKTGNATGYTCGYLWTRVHQPAYVPNAKPTFMLVKPEGGPDMTNGGDSGGPVYLGNSAYGLVSGEIGLPWCVCDLIFTAVDYVEAGVSVRILTSPP